MIATHLPIVWRCIRHAAFLVSALVAVWSALPVMAQTATSGQLVITEFRLRGPSGASDEYIVIQNVTNADHTVSSFSGTGYGVIASSGLMLFSIPNGTVIPRGGFYLGVNSSAYSLSNYPAGNGTTATGDASFSVDIPDNSGIAIFNNTVPADFNMANRLDAVGSTAESNPLFREGAGYPALANYSMDYALVRDRCGKAGSISAMGPCPVDGAVVDSNDNAADFIFVDTNGTSAGAGQRLGAPSPRNQSSPRVLQPTGALSADWLDTCAPSGASPNTVRDITSDPANNSTFGTLDLRHNFTNLSGADITRLRFRIIDLTTFPAPSGYADLRARTSATWPEPVDRPPCGTGTSTVTVNGTTLEQPASQPNGGGFNSTLSTSAVSAASPLVNGASIDMRFLFGVQQRGAYKIRLLIEGLPQGGGGDGGTQVVNFEGNTEGPTVTINQDTAQADPGSSAPVHFKAVFDSPVSGFTGAGVQLSGTAGATTAVVTGGPVVYDVAVSGMSSAGTVIASIPYGAATDAAARSNMASTSSDNTVTFLNLDVIPPSVTVEQAAAQADPAITSSVNFSVMFSEPVSGFTAANVVLAGTAGATTAVVSGGPTSFTVAVSGMTSSGTVSATIPAGVVMDGSGNANLASTSVDNMVTYLAPDTTAPSVIIDKALGQADPTSISPIHYTVTFSEPVTGFSSAGVQLSGTAAATTVTVTGGPDIFDVAISGMTGNGTVLIAIPAGAATDLAGNPNRASMSEGSIAVTWSAPSGPSPEPAVQPVPSLSEWAKLLLSWCIVGLAVLHLRRSRPRGDG